MSFTRRAVHLLLRAALALTLLATVVGQVLSVPGQFRHMAEEEPDLAHLRWPLTVTFVVLLVCVQVVVVCTWRLLTFVERDRIFSEESLVWVDVIVGAVVTAWLVFAGLCTFVTLQQDDPGTPAALFFLMLVSGAFALLLFVMRALLRQATTLRTDMEAVI